MAKKRSGKTKTLHRCLTECAVQSIPHEYSRAFGRGAVVDMSEPVAEGVTLGDLLADAVERRLFEPVEETAAPDEGSVNDGA